MSATVTNIKKNISPRQKIAKEAERLFEKLLTYYGDDDDALVATLEEEATRAGKGLGGSGDFAFITWANEQIATFETLANLQK